ncbi:MAG: sulfonate ABC transporter ATP-binding protein [Candidatus Rokuibacteriota bacterium]|nr:MAG: sulfonate ABC transporter ATP-binding protein [Candidatus Rokubacteria bacterium]
MATLEVEGLCKSYRTPNGQDMPVLKDVSFTAADGEFVAIVGPSGCGKTTFLRVLDGLAGADGGSIALDGRPIAGPGPDRGFVFQSDSLLPWRTVADNIGFGLELQRRDRATARRMVSDLVRLVGLEGFERYYPHQLSGGMRQRVNLARALAIDPGVLLMDEPFAALDAQTRELMQAELLRIWAEAHKTVVFITHQIDEAVYLADRVVVFSARPSVVKATITVDIPRPRPLSAKRQPAMLSRVDEIWRLIEEEVRR